VSPVEDDLRHAAAVAERAAIARQYACRVAGSPEVAIVASLQLVSEHLNQAARLIDSWRVVTAVELWFSIVSSTVSVVAATVALLLVPDPADPGFLVACLTGALVLGVLGWAVVAAIGNRRSVRTAASGMPVRVHVSVRDLRDRITHVRARLPTFDSERYLKAGGEIEVALIWLDCAEADLERLPPLPIREYRYRF
jgi:hypothetical protein